VPVGYISFTNNIVLSLQTSLEKDCVSLQN